MTTDTGVPGSEPQLDSTGQRLSQPGLRTGRRRAIRLSALGCTLALVVGVGSLNAQPVSAQTPAADDPVLLRELVERIAGDGYGVKAKLLLGTLPVVTPTLAVPSGWRVVGSVVREIPSGLSGASASVENSSGFADAPVGSTAEAVSVLTKTLIATGWIEQNFGTPPQSGFVVANSPQPTYAQFCGKNVNLSVNAVKETTGPVKVSFSVNTTPAGFPTQCAPAGSPTATLVPQIPAFYKELPRLVLPEKAVLVTFGGGGGSQFSSASGLTIDKADPPSVLESIFAPQMVDAGWQKTGGANTDSASVSTWRKKSGDTPLQATLLIVNAIGGDQRRDLTITVSQEASANGFPGGVPFPVSAPFPAAAIAPQTTIAISAGPPEVVAKSTGTTKSSGAAKAKAKVAVRKASSAKKK
jgi:hypothetical protein